MDLKEYYKIFKQNISVAIYTVTIFVIAAYIWSVKKSETYTASLLLNLTRTELQRNSDFRYDQFYRIEADDKFADTIKQWLKNPGVVAKVYNEAHINSEHKTLRQLSKDFKVDKLSPEIVEVRLTTVSREDAEKISEAIGVVISEKIKLLNSDARDPNWFKIIPSDPIILKNTQNLIINLSAAAAAGLFLGAIFAFVKHYLKEDEGSNKEE